MFSKLISRNSKRNRKENGLFFSSLLISIIAFYIILSLPHQDIFHFLMQMESDAVTQLMDMIPVFYGTALFILFFLIYYASKFQLEQRRHEFGVYLMMGMRRMKLFVMLLAEDLHNSITALFISLPAAILLAELISLITARLVGIGIIGHQVSFSLQAVLWTAVGFLLIKSAAFLILSGQICRQEIGSLLVDTPDGTKKQLPAPFYAFFILAGIICLAAAYRMAIHGESWLNIRQMGLTMALGILGTISFFQGLRILLGFAAKAGKHDRPLHTFNFRQIQETVIHRCGTLAICSLLILAAACCFGAGIAISRFYGDSGPHILDYTFSETDSGTESVRQTLAAYHLDTQFSDLFEIKIGYPRTTQDRNIFQMEPLLSALQNMPPSRDRDILINNLEQDVYPHLISLSGYNYLLAAAGLPELELSEENAAVYMDADFVTGERLHMLNSILKTAPKVRLDKKTYRLTGSIQTTNFVTDRSITLSFALILPDQVFEYYTQGDYSIYLNGILSKNEAKHISLMSEISDMNQKLDQTGLSYESYLQNMGRQLFYMAAASYITIYLAIIFLIIANTIIGVQFLMSQRKSGRRYRTLIRLGASYAVLCRSAQKQICWYFGIPVAAAVCSSLFGVRALLTGLLPSAAKDHVTEMLAVSAAMIFALCVVECIYISAVSRLSRRYLLTLMVPEREE